MGLILSRKPYAPPLLLDSTRTREERHRSHQVFPNFLLFPRAWHHFSLTYRCSRPERMSRLPEHQCHRPYTLDYNDTLLICLPLIISPATHLMPVSTMTFQNDSSASLISQDVENIGRTKIQIATGWRFQYRVYKNRQYKELAIPKTTPSGRGLALSIMGKMPMKIQQPIF